MDATSQRPFIGVGVIVSQKGRVLLGQRKNSHGEGDWGFPGGHLEHGETIEACAARELAEETGLKALSLRVGPWNSHLIDGKHYITFFVYVDQFEGEPTLLEPHKCTGWEWFSSQNLPAPLFSPVQSLFQHEYTRDTKTVVHTLVNRLVDSHQSRDWQPVHSPKNLVMDLLCEAGELAEPFRWLTEEQSAQLDETTHSAVKEKVGDVFNSLLYLAHKLGIDPVEAAYGMLKKMNQKAPLEPCQDKALQDTTAEASSAANIPVAP